MGHLSGTEENSVSEGVLGIDFPTPGLRYAPVTCVWRARQLPPNQAAGTTVSSETI